MTIDGAHDFGEYTSVLIFPPPFFISVSGIINVEENILYNIQLK